MDIWGDFLGVILKNSLSVFTPHASNAMCTWVWHGCPLVPPQYKIHPSQYRQVTNTIHAWNFIHWMNNKIQQSECKYVTDTMPTSNKVAQIHQRQYWDVTSTMPKCNKVAPSFTTSDPRIVNARHATHKMSRRGKKLGEKKSTSKCQRTLQRCKRQTDTYTILRCVKMTKNIKIKLGQNSAQTALIDSECQTLWLFQNLKKIQKSYQCHIKRSLHCNVSDKIFFQTCIAILWKLLNCTKS